MTGGSQYEVDNWGRFCVKLFDFGKQWIGLRGRLSTATMTLLLSLSIEPLYDVETANRPLVPRGNALPKAL